MISASAIMCSLALAACHRAEAQRIAQAIDASTQDEAERALSVTYSWLESGWREHPRAWSWDAKGGRAHGPWQLWGEQGTLDLPGQARAWIGDVRQGGIERVDSSARRARERTALATHALSLARAHAEALLPPPPWLATAL